MLVTSEGARKIEVFKITLNQLRYSDGPKQVCRCPRLLLPGHQPAGCPQIVPLAAAHLVLLRLHCGHQVTCSSNPYSMVSSSKCLPKKTTIHINQGAFPEAWHEDAPSAILLLKDVSPGLTSSSLLLLVPVKQTNFKLLEANIFIYFNKSGFQWCF